MACSRRFSAAAADSSTSDAFCCVIWSSWLTAVLTWAMPPLLFGGGGGDFLYQVVHFLHRRHDLLHGGACGVHLAGARPPAPRWPGSGGLLISLAGFGAALGQAAHFTGHHGKAAALFARAGGFHRSIQRRDVGLEGDAVDHADDVGDAVR